MPFTVPFATRAGIYDQRRLADLEAHRVRSQAPSPPPRLGGPSPAAVWIPCACAWQAAGSYRVSVRRDRVFEMGMDTLNRLGPQLKRRVSAAPWRPCPRGSVVRDGGADPSAAAARGQIQVEFVDQFGSPEAGIDAGGLFKEFWTSLSAIAFDPSYGLFKVRRPPQPHSASHTALRHTQCRDSPVCVGFVAPRAGDRGEPAVRS